MQVTEAEQFVVCAGQRVNQEGSSPSIARMRSSISKGGSNDSPDGATPFDRVFEAIRNPKGLRRSIGL